MSRAPRILSAWFPSLPIERWSGSHSGAETPDDVPDDSGTALIVEGAHGPILHAVTAAAAAKGARPGMRLTDARALNPALRNVPADLAGDRALLGRLARWAGRWSPLVEVDGEDGLRLDIGGVAHLFGGEKGLSADLAECFGRLGLTIRTAIAPTPGAAWALARFGRGGPVPASKLGAALAPLPVAALRLAPHPTRTLERLGLKTIGELAGIERRSLARRFREADNPLDALDRMLGKKAEPLTAAPTVAPPRAALRLEEPATHIEAAPQALARLIPRLARELEERRLGARQLILAGYRVDGSIAEARVATAIPSRDPKHLQRLLAEKAESLDPGFGFDAFILTASWAEPLGAAQDSLVEEPCGEADVARLIDRLSVKLGAARVRRPAPVDSHLPERSSGWATAISLRCSDAPRTSSAPRPHRLLDRPEAIAVIYATPEGLPRRFVWRRAVHDIARVAGPERIAPEWWRQASSARLRDYYQVEDQAGRRYWIYREGLIGDGRGGAPEWFIHGLFG